MSYFIIGANWLILLLQFFPKERCLEWGRPKLEYFGESLSVNPLLGSTGGVSHESQARSKPPTGMQRTSGQPALRFAINQSQNTRALMLWVEHPYVNKFTFL